MMIGLMTLAIWIAAAVSAAFMIHVGKRQERPPLPIPGADSPNRLPTTSTSFTRPAGHEKQEVSYTP
ncbi:MAG: hypothetical protein ACRDMV_09745 [Streptosporangiales bacterium]